MRTILPAVVLLSLATAAQAQAPTRAPRPWYVDFSLMNGYDGNINHDPEPVRSYGLAPGVSFRYEHRAFELGYDVAFNSYTNTDEWDRISQGVFAMAIHRAGPLRFETGGNVTLKGSSEDRELANEYAFSERVVLKLTSDLRVIGTAALRYKKYPLDPETSGFSPYVGAKLDRRFGDNRLTVGYKYQTRHSEAVRDRYRRHVYSAGFSMPLDVEGDELSVEVEYRPQVYERLIRVGDARVLRRDRRFVMAAAYERPISPRVSALWLAALEKRDSNDPDKRYVSPSLVMTMRYRWR
jgi:hypothetical protein